MAVIELKKFVWTDSRTLTEYSARTVSFSKANPDTDGVSDFSARYDHTHKAANLKYDADFQCINLVNKTKLYALKSQTDMEVWVSNEIAKKTEQIEWKNAVNNYSELLNVAQPKDGWMVPVLQDQTISGTYYQSGDYRYHDNTLHPTGQASGWYLINSTKVPNASATINGLMTSADFTKLASLSSVPNFGTGHEDVARGDHNHDAVYVKLTDPRLTDARKASDVYAWAKATSKPAYAFSEITSKPTTLAGYGITDSVSTNDPRLTDDRKASDVYAWAKATSKPAYAFSEITSKPTTLAGYGITDSVSTNDPRLTDDRKASDVYAWAKQANKPGYTASEVGAAASSHTHTSVVGIYTGGGGNFAPTYVGSKQVIFNMRLIPQLMGGATYVDCLSMNCYSGGDVPFVTSMGVTKTSNPRGFIASAPLGHPSVDSWVYREIACIDNLPTLASLGGVSSTDPRLTDSRQASDVYAWAKASSKPSYTLNEINQTDFGTISLNTVYRQPLLRSRVGGGYITHIQLGTKRYTNESWGRGVLSVGNNDNATSFIDYEFDVAGRIYSPAGQFALISELPTLESLNGIPKTASCYRNWNWVGQNGQPTWLWGGNDVTNQYLYNPLNFNVASATYSNNCNADLQMNSKWIRNCIDIAFASDIRLKKDFVPITQELTNGVLDIKPFQYEFKKEPGKKRVGYIAQDVQAVFPDMVSLNHNEDDEENPETLAFSYRELMILKLEALVEEVNNLKQEIADLKRNK